MIYRKCAEEFDFKIVKIEGKVYSIGDELFPVFGYANRDALSQVLNRNNIESERIWNVQNERRIILQEFRLNPKISRLNLIDYRGFLTIALEGTSNACDRVREYLLKMETKARVDSVVYETTGMDASDFQTVGKYSEDSYAEFRILEGMRQSNQKDEAKKRHSIALRDMFHPVGSESKDSRLKKFSFLNETCNS